MRPKTHRKPQVMSNGNTTHADGKARFGTGRQRWLGKLRMFRATGCDVSGQRVTWFGCSVNSDLCVAKCLSNVCNRLVVEPHFHLPAQAVL